jgi:hypothetical protein
MRYRVNIQFVVSSNTSRNVGIGSEPIRSWIGRLQRHSRHVAAQRESPELLWRYSAPRGDRPGRWLPHRVVRKTDQAVFVEARPYRPKPSTGASRPARIKRIARADLAAYGYARVASERTTFFARPQDLAKYRQLRAAAERVGTYWPCSEAELRQAHRRRALDVHPDSGGDEESFIQLQADFERVLAAVRDETHEPPVMRGRHR